MSEKTYGMCYFGILLVHNHLQLYQIIESSVVGEEETFQVKVSVTLKIISMICIDLQL